MHYYPVVQHQRALSTSPHTAGQIYYYPVAQQQWVRSIVSPHTLLSITSAVADLIKQKALILLNNLFSSPSSSIKKTSSRKHFFSWMNYYISNPYLPTHQIQNTQITPTNTSHILLKYYPCYWIPTNILYTQAHKLSWVLSKILPIISHISSNLNSPQIILIILLSKLSRKITLSPHKAQHHLACGQNPKKAQTP